MVKPALKSNDYVASFRKKAADVGLKRVEVLVPIDKVDALKAYAADLREGDASEKLKQVRKLIRSAYGQYHARHLDNISINPEQADFADAAIVAAALMNKGSGKAYELGQRIRRLAR